MNYTALLSDRAIAGHRRCQIPEGRRVQRFQRNLHGPGARQCSQRSPAFPPRRGTSENQGFLLRTRLRRRKHGLGCVGCGRGERRVG